MNENDALVLNHFKAIFFVNQQNLTTHERIVCVDGKIYASVKSFSARNK